MNSMAFSFQITVKKDVENMTEVDQMSRFLMVRKREISFPGFPAYALQLVNKHLLCIYPEAMLGSGTTVKGRSLCL